MMALHQNPTLRRSVCGVAALLFVAALSLTGYGEQKTISPEKAKLIGYVEDFLMNNFRDVTMRKSLEWGDVKTDDKGNNTIRYRCEALIWDKDRMTLAWDFTFDKDGKYVSQSKVESTPVKVEKPDITTAAGVKRLVEKFFSENFRDITARKTIKWGNLAENEDGGVSITYRYEATIWDKDKIINEQKFTFDKDGKYVGHETLNKEPVKNSAEKTENTKPDTKSSQRAAAEGWRLFTQGKPDEALPKFEEAVKLDPKNANAYQGLGWAQFNLGESDDAQKSWAKCIELDPKNSAALNGLGWAAWKEGKKDNAIEHWTKAVAADKNATAAIDGLAKAYEEKGDKSNAAKYYKMLLDAVPDSDDAKKGLERMK